MRKPSATVRLRALAVAESGPVSAAVMRAELAGWPHAKGSRALERLLEEGLIRRVIMDRKWFWVAAGWVEPDESIFGRIGRRVKQDGGCLIWGGHVDDDRGPMIYANGAPRGVRRVIYQVLKRPLRPGYTLAMKCDNPQCVDPDCMKPRRYQGHNKGEVMPVTQRLAIAKSRRAQEKLDPEKVEEIRSLRGVERAEDVAAARDLNINTIYDIWGGRTWKTYQASPFAGLAS